MTSVSLTQLRQNLFSLVDQVIDSGEALVIERRGVRLQLGLTPKIQESTGRLARLKSQALVIGAPLSPQESPALWLLDSTQRSFAAELPTPHDNQLASKAQVKRMRAGQKTAPKKATKARGAEASSKS